MKIGKFWYRKIPEALQEASSWYSYISLYRISNLRVSFPIYTSSLLLWCSDASFYRRCERVGARFCSNDLVNASDKGFKTSRNLTANSCVRSKAWLQHVLGAFSKSRKESISFSMSVRPSVRPSAWNNSAPTGQIFIKFDTWVFFEKHVDKNFSFIKIWQE
jgi:hypothetical protein